MAVPDLATLVRHPDQAADVDPDAVPQLLAEVEVIRAQLWSRLHRPPKTPASVDASRPPSPPDRLLTTEADHRAAGRDGTVAVRPR